MEIFEAAYHVDRKIVDVVRHNRDYRFSNEVMTLYRLDLEKEKQKVIDQFLLDFKDYVKVVEREDWMTREVVLTVSFDLPLIQNEQLKQLEGRISYLEKAKDGYRSEAMRYKHKLEWATKSLWYKIYLGLFDCVRLERERSN